MLRQQITHIHLLKEKVLHQVRGSCSLFKLNCLLLILLHFNHLPDIFVQSDLRRLWIKCHLIIMTNWSSCSSTKRRDRWLINYCNCLYKNDLRNKLKSPSQTVVCFCWIWCSLGILPNLGLFYSIYHLGNQFYFKFMSRPVHEMFYTVHCPPARVLCLHFV